MVDKDAELVELLREKNKRLERALLNREMSLRNALHEVARLERELEGRGDEQEEL